MSPSQTESSRYDSLRQGGKMLGRLAWWVQLAFLVLGMGLFLEQAGGMLSDAQFTWGERRVMAALAVITLGGCALAGLILGRLLRVAAGVLDVMADSTEAAWRTGDLLEQHLIPTLGRIALTLEERAESSSGNSTPLATDRGADALKTELAAAQAAGRAGRMMDLRDQLTRHLRGESLHALDSGLAIWLLKLVETRVQAGTVDAELAGWVARALDSFGAMPEAEPLRLALPALRRRAGLCQKCGLPVRGQEATCPDCRSGRAAAPASSDPIVRLSSSRERS
jgi:hypothetical protein